MGEGEEEEEMIYELKCKYFSTFAKVNERKMVFFLIRIRNNT